MIDTGQTYEATCAVRNAAGVLANATTVTLTVTAPDGTVTTPSVVNPPLVDGKYLCDVVLDQAGLWKFAWLTTAPGTSTVDYVNARDFISIISLAEAKAHLDMTATADDDELRNFLQAATELVESKVGPCVRRTVTERVTEGTCELVLRCHPVISVTSVTSVWPGGPSWTTADLLVDGDAGIVCQKSMWPFWYGPWDVVEVVGRAVIPERFLHAAKEQLRHLWETQRGSSQAPPLAGEETFTTAQGWSFSVPRRVLELLAADMVPSV